LLASVTLLEAMERSQLSDTERQKRAASTLSLSFNLFQTVIKIAAALLTGSVSVLSEAAHSAIDVIASLLAYIGIRVAEAPPDDEHPYGHGKVESLAGFGESILLFGTVIYIWIVSVERLLSKPRIESIGVGLIVMAVSAAGCFLVSRYVLAVSTRTKSIALKSNGQHLTADCVTSIGVLLALGITDLTGIHWVDPVMAMLIACWMAVGASRLFKEAFDNLIDHRLSDSDLDRIEEILSTNPNVLGHHRLRSRFSGNMRYIDMHIVVPNDWTLVEAHNVADALEKTIAHELSPAQVVIHVDPYDAGKAAPNSSRKKDPPEPEPGMAH
jgi:cation diffusion facilitator family transporter